MEKSKAETFIGFSIRANKCKIGFNAVSTLKKAYVMVVCKTASENTVNDSKKLAKKLHARLYKTVKKNLEDITFRDNAKVLAITDKALSKAFIDNTDKEYIEIEQENK